MVRRLVWEEWLLVEGSAGTNVVAAVWWWLAETTRGRSSRSCLTTGTGTGRSPE
jgi:hypothetical protein